MLKIGDTVKRVWRESRPEEDMVHKVERFNADGSKVVLRCVAGGKAVTVKIVNIKNARPTRAGNFNGTYYAVESGDE